MELTNKSKKKIEEIKLILDSLGLIYEEKPNGQLLIDKISYWCTKGKWYNPKTNVKGEGINSFLKHLKDNGVY